MKYKKIVFAIALSAAMCSGSSALASGIPVVGAAAIAQMVQQLTQMQQMYSNMVQQYNTAVNTLQNFTGTRGLGLVDYNLNLRALIPSSARSRLMLIKQSPVSVMIRLDLGNFKRALKIFSGTAGTTQFGEKLFSLVGDDPDVWIPYFFGDKPLPTDKKEEI